MLFANLGNGLSETWKYDSRERLTSAAVGTGCSAGTCTNSKYSTSVAYYANGDVMAANDTANGNWVYTYDDFNRLISSVGGPNDYTYTYDYDRFGNRWNQKLNGACTAGTSACVQFDANNHMTNLVQSYDSAGNVVSDSMHSYAYNAENQLVSLDNGATTYGYEADGQRVFRTTAGVLTDFIYDRDGHIILINPATPTMVELYAGGMHLATKALNSQQTDTDTYFDHADWLGTERARTDVSGNLCETIASLPFGDGETPSSTCSEGDVSPMHFTGKERDIESGLDNFGARYNASSFGRFMSPDPLTASAKVWDPQTWNRYAYAHGNPLALIDPTGMEEVTAAQCAQDKHCVTVNVNVIYDKNANDGAGLTDKQKADFEKGQLQNAKNQYGDADIHLNVTYSAGAVTTDNGKTYVSGLQSGALNVVVTDNVLSGESGISGKMAVSFVNPEATDLAHEMAHQFMGDTQGWRDWLSRTDPLPAGIFLNAFTDVGNDFERAWMRGLDRHSGPFSHYPLASAFNHNAAVFQRRIQPTTKPQ